MGIEPRFLQSSPSMVERLQLPSYLLIGYSSRYQVDLSKRRHLGSKEQFYRKRCLRRLYFCLPGQLTNWKAHGADKLFQMGYLALARRCILVPN